MIFDLPNLFVCLTLVFAAYLLGKIKLSHALCLAAISFVPFCLNNVLFDPMYMPDQFTYLRILGSIRDFSYNHYLYNARVTEAALMYAFLPLPFVETINSLGFFNKFLLICVFIWAASVLRLRGWILWFLMLYPSLLLYSSLSLRDMLICTLMLLALWSLLRGWYVLTLVFIALLFEIKMQNALLVVLFSLLYLAEHYAKIQFTTKKTIVCFSLFFIAGYLLFPLLIGKIEYYRFRMFLEDGGLLADYHPIRNFVEFLRESGHGFMRTLFYPLPWAAKGALQLLQSLENLLIALLLFAFTWRSFRIIPKQTVLWLFFLISGLVMYGLIVANVGTIVRYKLPFIVVYFIFLSYERVRYTQNAVREPTYALNTN